MAYNQLFPGMENFLDGDIDVDDIRLADDQTSVIEQAVAVDELRDAEMALHKISDAMYYQGRLHQYIQSNGFSRELLALCGDDLRVITQSSLSEDDLYALSDTNSRAYLQAMEGFELSFRKLWQAFVAKTTIGLQAAMNYFSNSVSSAKELKSVLESTAGEKREATGNGLTQDQVREYMQHDFFKYLKTANGILLDFKNSSIMDSMADLDAIADATDDLEDIDNKAAKAAEAISRSQNSGTPVSNGDRAKLIKLAISQLDAFIDAKNLYPGFWKLGFTKGIPKNIISNLPFGVVLDYSIFRDYERLSTYGWAVIRHSGTAILAFANKVLRSYK